MRIVAGSLGGRVFDSPKSAKTHPMSERVRGALFNALGDLSGLTVLDAFAGSGALSFEAISRGAERAIAVESDRSAQKIIADTIRRLGLAPQLRLIKAATGAWLSISPDEVFDVVLCDPPYDDLQPNLLERLAGRAKPGGIVVFSLPPNAGFALPPAIFQLLSSKSYGDARLVFYRRIS
jgi:16S rRNA (guanine966-N2)-methyltransferase